MHRQGWMSVKVRKNFIVASWRWRKQGNGDCKTEPFTDNTRVKQGYVLAPALFLMYMPFVCNTIFRMSQTTNIKSSVVLMVDYLPSEGWKDYTKCSIVEPFDFQYADDWTILAHTLQDLQHAVDVLVRTYKKFGLFVRAIETKMMVYNFHRRVASSNRSYLKNRQCTDWTRWKF